MSALTDLTAERLTAYRIRRGHAGNPTPTEVRTAAEIELLDLYDPAAPSHRLDLIRALTTKSATTRREVA